MRKRKPMIKQFLALFLTFLMTAALSACGKEEITSAETPERAFGLDSAEELAMAHPEQVICSGESAWAITAVKNDYIYQFSYDTGAVSAEKIEWQPEDGNYSIINIAQQNGILYAEYLDMEAHTIEIRKRGMDGSWSPLMTIDAEDKADYAIVGSGLHIDSAENAYLVSGNTVARFDGEGKPACVYELAGKICFFEENREGYVECVTARADKLTLYRLSERTAEEKLTIKVSAGSVHGIKNSEEGILCLATDTEILFLDSESGGVLSRTDLVKLGISSILSGYYDEKADTLRLYGSTGQGSEGLRCSLLSSREGFTDQRTELIYGAVGTFDTNSESSIGVAINTFNRENEDYYITIKVYDGQSYSDRLNRLHADMAAGNGPDIIDMSDGNHYASYVKNGYLEDLSPYLEQSQYKDDIVWNVLDTYRIDGGLYMFVPQFGLRGVLLHPDCDVAPEEWNMETFLELIEKNQWEKDIYGQQGAPEWLLYYLICGRQTEFIDWEQKKAAFETEEFTDLLALCREYAQADWSDVKDMTYEEQQWNALCAIRTYGMGFWDYLFMADIYGREYPIYGFPMLSGQTYGIEATNDCCAIYAGSKQKEGAWQFIESLLWDSNQNYHGTANPGFPIRISLLKELAAEAKTHTVRTGFTRETLTITDSEIAILEDIIYNGNLSNTLLDYSIWDVIREETDAYFAGDKSAEETAHVIQSRVQLILDE